MRHKDRLNIMAWILSVIVNHATSGEVRKDIFLWGEKRMLLQLHSVPCIDYWIIF